MFTNVGCSEDPLTDEIGTSTSYATKGSGGVNGDHDFCNDLANKCVAGEGDCDNDGQCETGLICGANIGKFYGMPAEFDVCVVDHCANGTQDADEADVDCGGADCGACPTCPDASMNGGASYCSATCPCTDGEGDCDGDNQCAAGLVCGTNNGRQFGFPSDYDVCVTPHCANGTQDADETDIDCGGADCVACPSCPDASMNGGGDYCTRDCPCSNGEGDCDNNTHCRPGTQCVYNIGNNYGFAAWVDVCVSDTCSAAPPGSSSFCTAGCKCGEGFGDCDNNNQCQAGLVCGNNNGANFGIQADFETCVLPHCANGIQDLDEAGIDCGGADCGICP